MPRVHHPQTGTHGLLGRLASSRPAIRSNASCSCTTWSACRAAHVWTSSSWLKRRVRTARCALQQLQTSLSSWAPWKTRIHRMHKTGCARDQGLTAWCVATSAITHALVHQGHRASPCSELQAGAAPMLWSSNTKAIAAILSNVTAMDGSSLATQLAAPRHSQCLFRAKSLLPCRICTCWDILPLAARKVHLQAPAKCFVTCCRVVTQQRAQQTQTQQTQICHL